VQVLRRLLAPMGDDLPALRDRALLLVGFAGALRRFELVGIRAEDLEHSERGLRLRPSQTKGSQTEIVTVPPPYGETELCPVRALERCWIAASAITAGPLFRRIWRAKAAGVVLPPGEQEPPPLPSPPLPSPAPVRFGSVRFGSVRTH